MTSNNSISKLSWLTIQQQFTQNPFHKNTWDMKERNQTVWEVKGVIAGLLGWGTEKIRER